MFTGKNGIDYPIYPLSLFTALRLDRLSVTSACALAIDRFKKAEDVDKALQVSRDKLFFGCKIKVTPWDSGHDNEFRLL